MRKVRYMVTVSFVQDDQGAGNSPLVCSPLCSVGKTVSQRLLAVLSHSAYHALRNSINTRRAPSDDDIWVEEEAACTADSTENTLQ